MSDASVGCQCQRCSLLIHDRANRPSSPDRWTVDYFFKQPHLQAPRSDLNGKRNNELSMPPLS
jgi:hypothetical protein